MYRDVTRSCEFWLADKERDASCMRVRDGSFILNHHNRIFNDMKGCARRNSFGTNALLPNTLTFSTSAPIVLEPEVIELFKRVLRLQLRRDPSFLEELAKLKAERPDIARYYGYQGKIPELKEIIEVRESSSYYSLQLHTKPCVALGIRQSPSGHETRLLQHQNPHRGNELL